MLGRTSRRACLVGVVVCTRRAIGVPPPWPRMPMGPRVGRSLTGGARGVGVYPPSPRRPLALRGWSMTMTDGLVWDLTLGTMGLGLLVGLGRGWYRRRLARVAAARRLRLKRRLAAPRM